MSVVRLRELFIEDESAHRNAAAQRLRAGQDVRDDPVVLIGPHLSGAAHSALDLVEDEQRTV